MYIKRWMTYKKCKKNITSRCLKTFLQFKTCIAIHVFVNKLPV